MSDSLIQLVHIPKVEDDCLLCFAQTPDQIPFDIKRVYYISQGKADLPRGHHAHHKTRQILFCIQGKVTIIVDDGQKREEVILDQPHVGIMLDPMIWHEMTNINEETILLVLASEVYDESDYIRDYQQFKSLTNENH